MAIKKFTKKPKLASENVVTQKIDELNGNNTNTVNTVSIKNPVGRPKKEAEEKTVKKTITLRQTDLNMIDQFVNDLVDQGARKPFPTDIDIHRIGFMALDKLSEEERYQLFIDYKGN